jgi:hypothetical protein
MLFDHIEVKRGWYCVWHRMSPNFGFGSGDIRSTFSGKPTMRRRQYTDIGSTQT